LDAESVRALGALHSLRSKKQLSAHKRQAMYFLDKKLKEKWIEDYVEWESAVPRKRVEATETAILKELKDMTTAERAGATTRKHETTFEEMSNAIGDSLSNLARSDDEQDRKDKEDDEGDTELGKLNDDDKPGWVMGTISKTVQNRMESFRQMQMRLDELTQPGWGDAANYFSERDVKYGTAELKVMAVIKPQMDITAATPSPTTFGEHMQSVDVVSRQSQMPAVTSQPGSSQMMLGSEKLQLHKFIPVLSPDAAPDLTLIQVVKPLQPVSFYPCIMHHRLIAILTSDTDEDMVMAPMSPVV